MNLMNDDEYIDYTGNMDDDPGDLEEWEYDLLNALDGDLTDLPLEDYDTNALFDDDADYDPDEPWCKECGRPLGGERDDVCNDCAIGLANRNYGDLPQDIGRDAPYILRDFPQDPHYCECCGGVIIETDFLYTGSLDRCYFCMGNDCQHPMTEEQRAKWRASRGQA